MDSITAVTSSRDWDRSPARIDLERSDQLCTVALRRLKAQALHRLIASRWTMRALFVLGRTIFGGYFIYNGYNHFRHVHQMAPYAESKGVPSAESAVRATGAMLL